MTVGLVIAALIPTLGVLALRWARSDGTTAEGHAVRRIFQYLLLFGLGVVVANGLTGLVGRLLEGGAALARADADDLARSLAFTIVGLPLYVGLAAWSRRRLVDDDAEARSLGWACYVTAASLTSLVVTMIGSIAVLRWAVGLEGYSGPMLAQTLVWGSMWAVHWRIEQRVFPAADAIVHHLAGSLIGLATAATGLGTVLSGALRVLVGLETSGVLAGGGSPILRGLPTFVVGAAVWYAYWARTAAAASRRDPLRLAYVLLVGVAGGLVTAVVAASALLYSGLVWVIGEPGTSVAAAYFDSAPALTATAAVGALVWWYHNAVLAAGESRSRTEVRRIYEYLMAAVGLAAATGGLVTLVAALIEAVVGSVVVGGSTVNTLLAAATLIAIGGPVWWQYWARIQGATRVDAVVERTSPTRRVYVSVLFGVGAVATVVALVVAVYLLFQDVVPGTVGLGTLRGMRFAIGVLLAAPTVAGYHWMVRRDDRLTAPVPGPRPAPRFLLLIGPDDPGTAAEVARRTHARVEAWSRTDEVSACDVEDVMAVLEGVTADDVVVLSDAGTLRALPVSRRPTTKPSPAGSRPVTRTGKGPAG